MNHIPLEITVLSAQIFNNVTKTHLYTVVELHNHPFASSSSSTSSSLAKGSTPLSTNGKSGPFWWSKIIFQIQESKLMQHGNNVDGLSLTFHVKSRKTLIPDKIIGTVHVPVGKLLEYYYSSTGTEDIALGHHKRVAFTISSPHLGKLRGVLYLSYMFGSGEHKGILHDIGGQSFFPAVVPSAPYIGDDHVDLPVSTQPQFCYNSLKSIPTAPYMSEEDLQ